MSTTTKDARAGAKARVRLDAGLGASVEWPADARDTILRAALRTGVPFPYECNSGGCGSCKFELIEGEVEELWPDAPGLSPRDKRKGRKLACQCRPRGDVTIRARLEEGREQTPAPRRFSATFRERRDLTPDMAEFVFEPEAPLAYLPGQFAMFTIPGIAGDRAYSFSSAPQEEEEVLKFVIKRMPEGRASNWLFDDLRPGDALEMDAPYGLAYLRDTGRDMVLIGGGSGLSPMLSIARAAVLDERFAGRTVHMFYGGRGPRDICTPALIAGLKGQGAQLACYNACSDPELAAADGWDGPVCNVHELVAQTLSDLPQYDFYFCGPPPMTEAVQRMLMIEHKVPFEQLHFDRFF